MTITQINAACAPYEVSGNTTLDTIRREANGTGCDAVQLWIDKCLKAGDTEADYDTRLCEIEDVCGWRLCPFEGERLAIEAA